MQILHWLPPGPALLPKGVADGLGTDPYFRYRWIPASFVHRLRPGCSASVGTELNVSPLAGTAEESSVVADSTNSPFEILASSPITFPNCSAEGVESFSRTHRSYATQHKAKPPNYQSPSLDGRLSSIIASIYRRDGSTRVYVPARERRTLRYLLTNPCRTAVSS